MIKKTSRKNTANEESAPRRLHLWEKRPAEEPRASTSAVAPEQNNAGVDQGEKALLKIVMGFETLNKSIVLGNKTSPHLKNINLTTSLMTS